MGRKRASRSQQRSAVRGYVSIFARFVRSPPKSSRGRAVKSYLGDVLALELGEKSAEALIVGLNANGAEDLLDVGGRRGGVASQAEEEVCREVLHCGGFWGVSAGECS